MGLAATAVMVTERSIMHQIKSLEDHVRHLKWSVRSTNEQLEMLSHLEKRYEHIDYSVTDDTFRVLRFHKDDKVEVIVIDDVVFRCVKVYWKGHCARLLEHNDHGVLFKTWLSRMNDADASACVAATKGS